VGLALRFRPLGLTFSPSIGYSTGRGKVGRLGLARYFVPTSERKSGLLTIDGNPASANFIEPGKHGSSTLRIQIQLNAHSRFLRHGVPLYFKSWVGLSGRAMEVPREVLDGAEVSVDG
jgi:hypothetical protein